MNERFVIFSIPQDFQDFSVRFPRTLSTDEISRASGCIGYALRQTLCGEDLSEPEISIRQGQTVLSYFYDSTKSRRDSPDFEAAFELAASFVVFGTPVRKSNRAGPKTAGTSLVDGIGPVGMVFSFEDPEPAPALALALPDLTEVLAARDAAERAQAHYSYTLRQLAARL
jgi:hypothetical protein